MEAVPPASSLHLGIETQGFHCRTGAGSSRPRIRSVSQDAGRLPAQPDRVQSESREILGKVMAYPQIAAPQRLEPFSRFAATDWSLVPAAGKTNVDGARPAMGRLLETYWYPLYAFVRRKGRGPEDACDLTQEFLARLLERNFLSAADPSKGKFRTFLLTALERF